MSQRTSSHWQASGAHSAGRKESYSDIDSEILNNVTRHVLGLAENTGAKNTHSSFPPNHTPGYNPQNPYIGWTTYPAAAISALSASASTRAPNTDFAAPGTYDAFWKTFLPQPRGLVSKPEPAPNPPPRASHRRGEDYYLNHYDPTSPPGMPIPTRSSDNPSLSEIRTRYASVRSGQMDRYQNITIAKPSVELTYVKPDARPPRASNPAPMAIDPRQITAGAHHMAPKYPNEQPPVAHGPAIHAQELQLIQKYPAFARKIKIILGVKFQPSSWGCNRCREVVYDDVGRHIAQHVTFQPPADVDMIPCFSGNCYHRGGVQAIIKHVRDFHVEVQEAQCGVCLKWFRTCDLARKHLMGPCNLLSR